MSLGTLTPEQKLALEGMVDSTDVSAVVEVLADICSEKAQHIIEAWQDRASAAVWSKAALRLQRWSGELMDMQI